MLMIHRMPSMGHRQSSHLTASLTPLFKFHHPCFSHQVTSLREPPGRRIGQMDTKERCTKWTWYKVQQIFILLIIINNWTIMAAGLPLSSQFSNARKRQCNGEHFICFFQKNWFGLWVKYKQLPESQVIFWWLMVTKNSKSTFFLLH